MNHVELNPDDACMIKLTSGHAVDARYIECLIQDVIPAVEHAVVFGHNSPFMVVVFTLKLDPELGGRLLGEDAMHMSEQFGSKANTVFTARNCPQFCNGMRDVFRMINVALKQHCDDENFKIRRACLLLSKLNQEDGMIKSDGSYNRQQILRKHSHLINSMLDVQAARNVIDVTPCDDDETCDHGLKLRSYEDWLKFEQAASMIVIDKKGHFTQFGKILRRGKDEFERTEDEIDDKEICSPANEVRHLRFSDEIRQETISSATDSHVGGKTKEEKDALQDKQGEQEAGRTEEGGDEEKAAVQLTGEHIGAAAPAPAPAPAPAASKAEATGAAAARAGAELSPTTVAFWRHVQLQSCAEDDKTARVLIENEMV
ncbi:hypothetical protein GUITHDRAFT_145294 [Guillardia theta CCMP2712]|uniref:Uncharacterized protein n=1 Tax=Guillardia theta (strain CCMP2712) TaxID=905079 RepID=L1IML3_GUITC|nr:hypothetical protein GUITHDRAFT_145294 [Guillardia theta CCMP2712]EKX37050.1 hypothetical protein GUITHDRAFT_145294 [Guillardia theta CCMP2712]|eukprot:XP_005824030.1 hypothetical protein GUITHDRAFT_145294 [Guillardia theta CCMP2712]